MDQMKVRGRDAKHQNPKAKCISRNCHHSAHGCAPGLSTPAFGRKSFREQNLITRTLQLCPETWKMTLNFGNDHNSAQGRSLELSTPQLCRKFFREAESGNQKSKLRPRNAQKIRSGLVTKSSHNCSHSLLSQRQPSVNDRLAK